MEKGELARDKGGVPLFYMCNVFLVILFYFPDTA